MGLTTQAAAAAPVFAALRTLYVDCLFGAVPYRSILMVELPKIYEDLSAALDDVCGCDGGGDDDDDDGEDPMDEDLTATSVLLKHLAERLFTTTAGLERKYRDLAAELARRGWWEEDNDDGSCPPDVDLPYGFDGMEWRRLWEWRVREGRSARARAAARITALRISETKLQMILILESLRISRITGEPLVSAAKGGSPAKKRERRRGRRGTVDQIGGGESDPAIREIAKGDPVIVDLLRFVEYGIDVLAVQDVVQSGEMSGFVENVLNEFYLQSLPDVVAFVSERAGLTDGKRSGNTTGDSSDDEGADVVAASSGQGRGGHTSQEWKVQEDLEIQAAASMLTAARLGPVGSRRGSGMSGRKIGETLSTSSVGRKECVAASTVSAAVALRRSSASATSDVSVGGGGGGWGLSLKDRPGKPRPKYRSKMLEGLAKKQVPERYKDKRRYGTAMAAKRKLTMMIDMTPRRSREKRVTSATKNVNAMMRNSPRGKTSSSMTAVVGSLSAEGGGGSSSKAERMSRRMKKAEELMDRLMDPRAIAAALNGKQKRRGLVAMAGSSSSSMSVQCLATLKTAGSSKDQARTTTGESERERLKRSLSLTSRLRGSNRFHSSSSSGGSVSANANVNANAKTNAEGSTLSTTGSTMPPGVGGSEEEKEEVEVEGEAGKRRSSAATTATPRKFPGTPSRGSRTHGGGAATTPGSVRRRLSFGQRMIPQSTSKVIEPFMEADWDEIGVNLDSPIKEAAPTTVTLSSSLSSLSSSSLGMCAPTPIGVKKVVKIRSARKRMMMAARRNTLPAMQPPPPLHASSMNPHHVSSMNPFVV